MSILFIPFLFFWIVRIIANILSFVYLWYIKEYRFDRILVHIKSQGLPRVIFPFFRHPPLRPKAVILVLGSCVALLFLYIALPFTLIVSIIIVDLVSFPVVSLLVLLLKLPTVLYHELIYYQAKQKLSSHRPMLIVGITGSVGKTTTKEYLATILGTKFQVIKTKESQNSAIGVAETIMKDLRPEHEIFVVEMAAYTKGEIAKIAKLVKPQIGIVTTVNEQHLDLFGSLENTMEAKYELIHHLSGRSVAIFNADNPYTRRMAELAKKEGKEVWMYTKEGTTVLWAKRMFLARNITVKLETFVFTLIADNQQERITIALSGEHQVSTVLAAIAGSIACGMSIKEVASAAKEIRPFRKTMYLTRTKHGVLLVDDTFNNNPDAAKAALEFLSRAKGKKIFVFQPMIELGSYTEEGHKEVGALAGKICDEIILTNPTFSQFFIERAKAAGFRQPIHIFSPQTGAAFIQSHTKKGDMVLFKGKEAAKVLEDLSSRA